MEPVQLICDSYEAIFLPSHGMNLISFKKGGIEVIDPSTKEAFENRSSGLGPLIGPHFHRRLLLPKINEEGFPQYAYCKEHKISDLFSHGVARYVPWKYERTENGIKAILSGKDVWYGIPLSAIEGQNFEMRMDVALTGKGLNIDLSVVSDSDSLVGIHYYYRLPKGKGVVRSKVKEGVLENFLNEAVDQTFRPYPNPRSGAITLVTDEYVLETEYQCVCEENSWQLYHPQGASFVCIEPLSAQDPRHPNLSVSGISIQLEVR